MAYSCAVMRQKIRAPLYAFPKGVQQASLPIGDGGRLVKVPPPSRWRSKKASDNYETLFHQCAPFEMNTVFGAIGDLVGCLVPYPKAMAHNNSSFA